MKGTRTVSITGLVGSTFAALCCIGASALVAFVGALGAGFLIQDRILIPILIISLVLSLIGLIAEYRKRHGTFSLVLGLMGIGSTLFSVLSGPGVAVYLGLGALLAATSINLYRGMREHRTSQKTGVNCGRTDQSGKEITKAA